MLSYPSCFPKRAVENSSSSAMIERGLNAVHAPNAQFQKRLRRTTPTVSIAGGKRFRQLSVKQQGRTSKLIRIQNLHHGVLNERLPWSDRR